MGQVRVGAAIGASFRFVGEAWSKAWGIMLISVWFAATLEAIQLLKPEWGVVSFLGLIATLFLSAAATGALYRLRFAEDHPGDGAYAANPAGLQWGGLEWRVLGASLLIGVIIAVIFVVALIIWGVALGVTLSGDTAALQAVENGSDSDKMAALGRIMLGPGGLVSAVILIPTFGGVIYLAARLAVFAPLAAETRAFDVGKAWAMTKGAVLTLIVGAVVIYLVLAVIGAVAGGLAGLFAGVSGQAGGGRIWGGIAGQAIAQALSTPLFAGLALYVYRIQRGDPGVAATFS
jgi:hypothetical protein